ncbi:Maf family protein [Gluconacetobacter diazotrophicus PA1 5]|nr:Maf family protein [Gluconacetobacter diazotrophicus]ACI51688.1 Maf family protein [Gluconacetobacter diazotrophicus PA1 5]MBB2155272.1 Maf-like protein [Gluconacetobacter diazotrophicus]TWB11032.1 septum formation protein [Gluconacetobacter diazotrophicus]
MSDSSLVLPGGPLQAESPLIVLASQSATRRILLEQAGLCVECRPARVDEDGVRESARAAGLSPDSCALLLAELKGGRIRDPGCVVIGADQILSCEGEWFEKPADRQAARAQLWRLRGRMHVLHSAVVVMRDGQVIWRHVARPELTMRPFSEAFLDAYLDIEGDAILSSVGAYRLEGCGVHLFDGIVGEHAAILGLPLLPLLGFLRQHGVVLS